MNNGRCVLRLLQGWIMSNLLRLVSLAQEHLADGWELTGRKRSLSLWFIYNGELLGRFSGKTSQE